MKFWKFLFVGPLFSVFEQLNEIQRKQDTMAQQSDIDALTLQVGDIGRQLNRGLGEISDKIGQLEAGEPVDLSALKTQIESVAAVAQSLDDLVPDEPVEPTDPETPVEPEPEQPVDDGQPVVTDFSRPVDPNQL